MRIEVLYFGVLREVFGATGEPSELPDGAPVAELLTSLAARGKVAPGLWSSLAVAVNRVYARADTVLREGDEVALLPPVSGGSCRAAGVCDAG